MSPWVTILKILFIAPHFPRPALTPTAFLCFCVRPRKLSFLVCGRVFISLFYHLELDPQKHWGPRQPSPIDGLLIYRAGQQHIQALFYALWRVSWNASPSNQNLLERFEWTGLGKLGLLKVQKNNRITVAFNCLILPTWKWTESSLQHWRARKTKRQLYLSRENRGEFCVESVAQSKPEKYNKENVRTMKWRCILNWVQNLPLLWTRWKKEPEEKYIIWSCNET